MIDPQPVPRRDPDADDDEYRKGQPVNDVVQERMITAPQLRYLAMLLRRHVEPGRDEQARRRRHAFLEWILNRDITSTKDLTKVEASQLIDGLSSQEHTDATTAN
jgi:hypothetical protein